MNELQQLLIGCCAVVLACGIVGALGAAIYSVVWKFKGKGKRDAEMSEEEFFEWLMSYPTTAESLKKLDDIDMEELKK